MMSKTTCSDHSIERSEQINIINFGEVATPKVLHYMNIRQYFDRKHACSFWAASEPCRSTDMSPGLAVMTSIDFDSDVALRTQIPVN